jgi:RecA-family ATPase
LRRLGLPITAIIDSGKKSVHAWVRIDAKTREEYDEKVALIHQFCSQSIGLDVDRQNKNPSRYSRMADVRRAIDFETDEKGITVVKNWGQQRLLELNVPGKSWNEWESEVRAMAAEAEDEKTFTVSGLLDYDLENDPKSLIGNRWLCEGSSLLITGPTGVGKSSFIMTLAVDWALGERPFGLAPKRPLKTLIIQAENDEGDLATPLQGLLSSRDLNKAQIGELNKRIIFKQVATKTGEAFADYLRAQVEKHKPDIVIADLLLSYAGCGLSDQEGMSKFLRSEIQPILNETGVILAFVHHTSKPPRPNGSSNSDKEERRSIYDSLGTTDLTNWAREIVTISYEDWENRIFKLEFQKRAKRAGIVGEDGKPIYSLRIQHSKDRVAWEVVGNVFTGKATTKAQAQRSGRVKEVQDWMRETIIEYGDISQSTLKMRGGADLGHPQQMFVEAAEMLAEHNSGSDPIRKYKDKEGKVWVALRGRTGADDLYQQGPIEL